MEKIKEFISNTFSSSDSHINFGEKFNKLLKKIVRVINIPITIIVGAFWIVSLFYMMGQIVILHKPFGVVLLSIIISMFLLYAFYFCIKSTRKNIAFNNQVDKETIKLKRRKFINELVTNNKAIIDLVDRSISVVSKQYNMNKSFETQIFGKPGWNYLIAFCEDIEEMENSRPEPKQLDSFTIASCLINAIINNPVMAILDEYGEEVEKAMFNLNYDIALNSAFEIISTPYTYEINERQECVKKTHPKVDIEIPRGLDITHSLEEKIQKAIYDAYMEDENLSTEHLANLLELLYLYCQK